MLSALSTSAPSNTPGGRIAARRGRRTSAGGLITRLRRPRSDAAREQSKSTRTIVIPTTRRSRSTTITHFDEQRKSVMKLPLAAEVGMPLADVDTPCLMLELDPFERNLQRLPDSLRGNSIRLRPHAKSHKCP